MQRSLLEAVSLAELGQDYFGTNASLFNTVNLGENKSEKTVLLKHNHSVRVFETIANQLDLFEAIYADQLLASKVDHLVIPEAFAKLLMGHKERTITQGVNYLYENKNVSKVPFSGKKSLGVVLYEAKMAKKYEFALKKISKFFDCRRVSTVPAR